MCERNGLQFEEGNLKHDELIGRVQHGARLGSRGQAERATGSRLVTLAERLAGGEAKDLAAQHPLEIGKHLKGQWTARDERFSMEECLRRVGVDLPDTVFHARGLIEVLGEAVSKGEIDDVRARLNAELDRLFGPGGYSPNWWWIIQYSLLTA
jgi:uncharacterized protein (DUF2267 family)